MQVMLIYTLIDVQYLQNVDLNCQNHSTDSQNLIKKSLDKFPIPPTPKYYLENLDQRSVLRPKKYDSCHPLSVTPKNCSKMTKYWCSLSMVVLSYTIGKPMEGRFLKVKKITPTTHGVH